MIEISQRIDGTRDGRVVALTVLFVLFSVPFGLWVAQTGLASTGTDANSYFVTLNLFRAQDIWAGPLVAVLTIFAVLAADRLEGFTVPTPRLAVLGLAFAGAALSVLLRFVAHHNYGLSLDEFMPTFQAEIFRSGHLMAPLSETAFDHRAELQPFFTYVDEGHRLWMQHYRPIHAALLALFPAAYDVAIAHALLTGITVIALADIARRFFPDRRGAPVLAAIFLLASPQVLLTSASGFSFTMHLALNTVWLALFLRGTWPAHVAAATVGFFALGIHQVHVHAIYVFPFGIAMLGGWFGCRWKALPYIVAYGVGVPFWICWPEIATYIETGDPSVLPRKLSEVEYLSNYFNFSQTVGVLDRSFSGVFLAANLLRFVLWMSPGVILLLVSGLVFRVRIGVIPMIAGIGFLFTLAMSHLMLPNPMHTLGSRYYHPALANLVIVALAVFYALDDHSRLRRASVALALIGAVVLLPWRAWQVHEKVGPRAAIQAALDALPLKSIVIRSEGAWFMSDFVRNDPYLTNRPVIYAERGDTHMTPMDDGPVAWIDGSDLIGMGLPQGTWLEPDFTR